MNQGTYDTQQEWLKGLREHVRRVDLAPVGVLRECEISALIGYASTVKYVIDKS